MKRELELRNKEWKWRWRKGEEMTDEFNSGDGDPPPLYFFPCFPAYSGTHQRKDFLPPTPI